jgi:hypothetical protein
VLLVNKKKRKDELKIEYSIGGELSEVEIEGLASLLARWVIRAMQEERDGEDGPNEHEIIESQKVASDTVNHQLN